MIINHFPNENSYHPWMGKWHGLSSPFLEHLLLLLCSVWDILVYNFGAAVEGDSRVIYNKWAFYLRFSTVLIDIGWMFLGWAVFGCLENVSSLTCRRNLDDGTVDGSHWSLAMIIKPLKYPLFFFLVLLNTFYSLLDFFLKKKFGHLFPRKFGCY